MISTSLVLGVVVLGAQFSCSSSGGDHEDSGSAADADEETSGTGGAPDYGGMGGESSLGLECGGVPDTSGEFSKKALLRAAGTCASHFTCEFFNAAASLGREVSGYVADPSSEKRTRARDAWVSAMAAWSMLVPFEFGPIVGVGTDKYHGRGIGSYVHPWPSPNLCEVSKQLVSGFYEEQGLTRVPPGARGLFALEAILFSDMSETGCPSSSTTSTTWSEWSEEERQAAKLAYARVVVDDVFRRAEELVRVWAPEGEDFSRTLVNAAGYGSEQEALTIVAWSLLYPYAEVRDTKVAPLAGISTSQPNPETPFARVDRESIAVNLRSFRALFQGCAGPGGLGFDDWLAEAGSIELRDDILSALDQVEVTLESLPPLHEASQEEMVAFYEKLKILSDLVKGVLLGSASPLNLKLPASAASDTD